MRLLIAPLMWLLEALLWGVALCVLVRDLWVKWRRSVRGNLPEVTR